MCKQPSRNAILHESVPVTKCKRTRRCTTRSRTLKYQVWYGGKDADRKMDAYSNLVIAMTDARFLLNHGWPCVIIRKVK